MEDKSIKLFGNRRIRTVWDEEKEDWYFSIVDVVGVLTDSSNPTDYLKKMRKRDEILGSYIGTFCPQVEMIGENGKKRKTLAANTEQILRIIQSILRLRRSRLNCGLQRLEKIELTKRLTQNWRLTARLLHI